jgi:hypothetical protein
MTDPVEVYLRIGEKYYKLTPIVSEGGQVRRAWSIAKKDKTVYTCSQHADGYYQCTCPDWEFRRSARGDTCKHLAALLNMGLLDESAL